jgi:hypothetical protein
MKERSQSNRSVVSSALLTLVAACFFSACSSTPNTVSNVDPSVDFTRYKTYAFVADLATDKQAYQSLETTHLKNSVKREMELRGFRPSDKPDVAINFSVETADKVRTRSVPNTSYGVGYDPYYDVYYDGWATTHSTRIDQYTEGKLKIDLIDVSSRKLVWQGSTKGRISKKDEKDWAGTLDGAVTEIFSTFPRQVAVRQ